MNASLPFHVEASRCIRCGACAALVPGVFDLSEGPSRVTRAPTQIEARDVEAARLICPTDAIRATPSADATTEKSDASPALVKDRAVAPRFDRLARGAERARWSLASVPWDDLDPSRATPELQTIVREMAFSENATYSATQRFLEAFFDDVDFSSWISVWFYEETRHPHVLGEWLRRVGTPLADDFILRGRITTPFMRSLIGTLVTNVISEITATQSYARLASHTKEPALSIIGRFIAGDEARHAATFFGFAERNLAALAPREALRERARGLEVLSAWLGGAQQATHPVAQMLERLDGSGVDRDAFGLSFDPIKRRVVRVIGLLLDVPLTRESDVAPALRQLLSERG